jgi:hypothetical protein
MAFISTVTVFAAVAAFLPSSVEAVDNGLAITPQMGCKSGYMLISILTTHLLLYGYI